MSDFLVSEKIRKPANKLRGFLIALFIVNCSLLIAFAVPPQKFPPVSGEIYGQAARGVRSVMVNGKPVSFDAGQNFRAQVKLKAGEKYLTLVINYENLRLIKKYLILRKSAVSSFKVFVPKEKIEKSISELKKRSAQSRREKIKILKARERARRLTLKQKELARQAEEKEKQVQAEKAWIKRTTSPKFFANEFKTIEEVAKLIDRLNAGGYGIPFKTRENSLAKLNEAITTPNLYDFIKDKNRGMLMNQKVIDLVKETQPYRYKSFAQLSAYQKKKVTLLNRLLIEALYPEAPQRRTWLVPAEKATPIPPGLKIYEYLYVWEFSEGKLLAVKERQGKYSADIYIPIEKKWLNLKKLSEKDLQELIERPAGSFEAKKK